VVQGVARDAGRPDVHERNGNISAVSHFKKNPQGLNRRADVVFG
jgi:hypothetical protein